MVEQDFIERSLVEALEAFQLVCNRLGIDEDTDDSDTLFESEADRGDD